LKSTTQAPIAEPPATVESQERMFTHLKRALTSVRFLWDFRGDGIFHVLRTVITRGQPTQKELQVFHGLAQQLLYLAKHYQVPHPHEVPKTHHGFAPPKPDTE
jgi:tRNA C32,U32 (ribose-2'-O)-methylase TrmJ